MQCTAAIQVAEGVSFSVEVDNDGWLTTVTVKITAPMVEATRDDETIMVPALTMADTQTMINAVADHVIVVGRVLEEDADGTFVRLFVATNSLREEVFRLGLPACGGEDPQREDECVAVVPRSLLEQALRYAKAA